MDYSLDEHILAATRKQMIGDYSAGYVQPEALSPVPVRPSPSKWRVAHHRRCLGGDVCCEIWLITVRAVVMLNIGRLEKAMKYWKGREGSVVGGPIIEGQRLLEPSYISEQPRVYEDQESTHQYTNESHITFTGKRNRRATINTQMNLML